METKIKINKSKEQQVNKTTKDSINEFKQQATIKSVNMTTMMSIRIQLIIKEATQTKTLTKTSKP